MYIRKLSKTACARIEAAGDAGPLVVRKLDSYLSEVLRPDGSEPSEAERLRVRQIEADALVAMRAAIAPAGPSITDVWQALQDERRWQR